MMETWDKCNTFLRRIEEGKITSRDKDVHLEPQMDKEKDKEKEREKEKEKEEEEKKMSTNMTDEIKRMAEDSMEINDGSGSLDVPPSPAATPIPFADIVLPTRLLAVQCVQLSDCSIALSALRCRLTAMENDVDWVKESRW